MSNPNNVLLECWRIHRTLESEYISNPQRRVRFRQRPVRPAASLCPITPEPTLAPLPTISSTTLASIERVNVTHAIRTRQIDVPCACDRPLSVEVVSVGLRGTTDLDLFADILQIECTCCNLARSYGLGDLEDKRIDLGRKRSLISVPGVDKPLGVPRRGHLRLLQGS